MGFTFAYFKRNKQTNNTMIKEMDKKVRISVMYHFPIEEVLTRFEAFLIPKYEMHSITLMSFFTRSMLYWSFSL